MRKGARHVGVGLGLLGALAWGACKGPEEAVLAALGSGCVLDSDCEGELVCVFQRCHQACETSVDCPRGERCVVGAPPTHVCLLEDETECVRNSDCPEVLICASDRKCRDECVADPDCLGDQVCAQQACALEAELVEGRLPEVEPDPEPSCAFDSECVFPKRCIDEVCRFECEVDADCPSQRCEDNRCDPLGPVAPTCVPGHQQGCACPTSGTGVQICADDGLGYGDCLGCGGMMGTAGACPPTGMMSDPSFVWGRALTFPAGLATTSAVMAHQSGDVVLAGTTTLPTDLGGQVVSPANGVDAFLARYGAGGSLQGVTTYDAGTGSVEVSALEVLPSGEVWLAGCYGGNGSTAPNLGGGPLAPPPGLFLMRQDASGNHLFSTGFTFFPQMSPSGCHAHDLTVGPGGQIAVGGGFYGTVNFGSGNISSPGTFISSSFVAAFDPTGVTNLFAREVGGGNNISKVTLAMATNGNVLVASQFLDTVDFGSGPKTAVDSYDAVIWGYDVTGTPLFDRSYDSADSNDLLFIGEPAFDGTSFRLVGAYAASDPPDFGGGVLPSGVGTNRFDLALDPAGNWVSDGTDAEMGATAIFLDGQGNEIIVGGLAQATTVGPCALPASSDHYIARRTPMGIVDWVRTFPSSLHLLWYAVGINGDIALVLRYPQASTGMTTTVDLGAGPLTGNYFIVKLHPTLP